MEDQEAKASYTAGYFLASRAKQEKINISAAAFLKGARDSFKGQAPPLSLEEIQSIRKNALGNMSLFKEKAPAAPAAGPAEEAAAAAGPAQTAGAPAAGAAAGPAAGANAAEEGKKFLEQNKTKPGVKVTGSGLQYEVITEGAGKSPAAADMVEVHYSGTLIDGTEFDSSYKRRSSAKFPLNRVIKGWTEGLQLMKEGAKYKFYIPSELAYGAKGAGQSVPPNAALIFEVDLLKVNPGVSAAPAAGSAAPAAGSPAAAPAGKAPGQPAATAPTAPPAPGSAAPAQGAPAAAPAKKAPGQPAPAAPTAPPAPGSAAPAQSSPAAAPAAASK